MKNLAFLVFLVAASKDGGFLYWLKHHLLTCPFKASTGIDCPGCGIQRSVIALVEGNFLVSFKLYPATVPIIGLIVFAIVHLKFDFKNGAFIIKMIYIAITLIIVINYVYKIFTNQLI